MEAFAPTRQDLLVAARTFGVHGETHFRRVFGAGSLVWAIVSVYIAPHVPYLVADHVLYAAHLCKNDSAWDALGAFFRVDGNTANHWAWRVLYAIPSALCSVVSLVAGLATRAAPLLTLSRAHADRLPAAI